MWSTIIKLAKYDYFEPFGCDFMFGKGSELTLWHFMEHGQPHMPELTLTPLIVGFNSRKRTKNSGSVLQEKLDCDAAL